MSVDPGARTLVVIPCLNEIAHLDGLLGQLASAASASDNIIVVADGGSTDGSREVAEGWAARNPLVHLLDNPARIQSAGVNAAVQTFGAAAEFLVRVDAHAGYPADYVESLMLCASATGADSVVVPMVTRGSGCFQIGAATAQNSPLGTGGARHRSRGGSGWVDHGHHALMRLERFRSLGGYDERFSHNEDAEYDVRLLQAGGRIWMAGDLELAYSPRSTPLALFRQYRNYGRGRARTVRLHGLRLKPRQALPVLILPAVIAVPLALSGVLWSPLAALALPALIWAGLCLVGGLVVGRSGPWPCTAMSGPAAMVMHLGWSLGFWTEAAGPCLAPVTRVV